MADPYQYTTLTSSLPYQPALFTEKQTVISRIRLDQRLGMLEEDDAHVLRLVEDLVAWSHQEFERSDEEIVRRARRGMAALPEGWCGISSSGASRCAPSAPPSVGARPGCRYLGRTRSGATAAG